MSNLNYKKNVISTINNLSIINSSIIIRKNEDKILINQQSPSTTLAYNFSAPKDSFDFNGEEVAFHNFPDFYRLFSYFGTPKLFQKDNFITITEKNSKIDYKVSDSENITEGPGPNDIDFADPEITFELKKEDIVEIEKMIAMLESEEAVIKSFPDKKFVTIKLTNNDFDNSFTKKYDTKKNEQEHEMRISTEVFSNIPKGDYLFEVRTAGIIRVTLQNVENVFLSVYTAEVEED